MEKSKMNVRHEWIQISFAVMYASSAFCVFDLTIELNAVGDQNDLEWPHWCKRGIFPTWPYFEIGEWSYDSKFAQFFMFFGS